MQTLLQFQFAFQIGLFHITDQLLFQLTVAVEKERGNTVYPQTYSQFGVGGFFDIDLAHNNRAPDYFFLETLLRCGTGS